LTIPLLQKTKAARTKAPNATGIPISGFISCFNYQGFKRRCMRVRVRERGKVWRGESVGFPGGATTIKSLLD
jgi:hypothetical protein